jgi:hypothetical protein
MKTITKKSLDELARTMNVIPEDERENYWGMYDNDCFWRCVSWLQTGDHSEAGAASWAYDWYVSEHGYSGINHLSSTYDSAIDKSEMTSFLQAHSMLTGSNANNRIVGLQHTSDLEYYRNNSGIPAYQNHNIILKSVNPDGSCEMYDPQHNVTFTASASESTKFVPISYGSI